MRAQNSKFVIKPKGRGCRRKDGFLQFTDNGEVVAEFGAGNGLAYNTLRTSWVQGQWSLEDVKAEIKQICEA